jgi:hypothetical protein
LSENLLQCNFGEFPHHPLKAITPKILNGPTSRNPVDLESDERGGQAIDWPTSTYAATRELSIQVPAGNETEMSGSAIMHEVQFSANDQ